MRQVVLIVCLLCLSGASAQGFVAGEDASGDSSNQIAPGVDVGAAITNDRTDILRVEFEEVEDQLFVRLGLTTLPTGTSGYLYRVVFDIGGTSYYTCWSVQYTGGTEEATQENVLGCSRFTSGTQVGPATRPDGIDATGAAITWPVDRSALGGAGLADIESTFADTWFRGVSNCCVGSTTNSQYMWNQADRAPDDGAYLVSYAPAATPLEVNLTAPFNRTSAPPGGMAQFPVNLTSTAAANISLVAHTPWNVTGLEPWDGLGNATRNITVTVPIDANGTHAFWLEALVAGNATARLELTIDMDATATGHAPDGPEDNGTIEDVQEAAAGRDSPIPLWLVLGALAAAWRRR